VLRVSWVSLVGHKDLEIRSMLCFLLSMMLFLVILYLISTACKFDKYGFGSSKLNFVLYTKELPTLKRIWVRVKCVKPILPSPCTL
jgi:hypothetical protein